MISPQSSSCPNIEAEAVGLSVKELLTRPLQLLIATLVGPC